MTITSLRGHALAYESVTLTAQDCDIYSAVFAASVLPTLQIPSTHAGQTHSAETMSYDLYCKKCLPWVAAWTLQWCDGGRRCSATDQPGLLWYSNSASNTLECSHVYTEIALDNELTSPVPNICGSSQEALSEKPVFIFNQVRVWFSFKSFLNRVCAMTR